MAPLRKVPAPVVSVGCFAARDVFTEAVVEKFLRDGIDLQMAARIVAS